MLYANRGDIRMVDAGSPRGNATIVVGHLEDAAALDFHYESGSVFWTDISLYTIKKTSVNHTGL